MTKTSKTILKRIRVTKTVKLIRRHTGQNHFRAKSARRVQRRQRAIVPFPKAFRREILARI